jgi:hypothetical protein
VVIRLVVVVIPLDELFNNLRYWHLRSSRLKLPENRCCPCTERRIRTEYPSHLSISSHSSCSRSCPTCECAKDIWGKECPRLLLW